MRQGFMEFFKTVLTLFFAIGNPSYQPQNSIDIIPGGLREEDMTGALFPIKRTTTRPNAQRISIEDPKHVTRVWGFYGTKQRDSLLGSM